MTDPEKIILPGEEEQILPVLSPEGFEHRNLVRRQDNLRPENGRRPDGVVVTPPYTTMSFAPLAALNLSRGFVFAFGVRLVLSVPDVAVLSVGSAAGVSVVFDPSGDLVFSAFSPSEGAAINFPLARYFSMNANRRLAVGLRMSDPNRFLCVWVDGMLVKTANKGTFATLPTTWADTNDLMVQPADGVLITSPQVRYFRGDPAPMGGNR